MPISKNTCLKYWVRADPNGFPVAGSMQGFPLNNPPCGQECAWILLKTTQYTIPDNCEQCRQPDGLRYFYQLDRKGNIVPNSLQVTRQYPTAPGSCSFYLEFKKLCCS